MAYYKAWCEDIESMGYLNKFKNSNASPNKHFDIIEEEENS